MSRGRVAVKKKKPKAATSKRSASAGTSKARPVASRGRPSPDADVYGASGGMPFAAPAVLGDRSHSRRSARELSWAEFDRQVQGLARQAWGFKAEAVVGIAHGGVFVGGAVASALKADFFPVRLTRRNRDSATRPVTGVKREMPRELAGKRVLIVDDICSSGDSLELASRLAKAVGAARVKTASLVSRPGGHAPDYTAFTTDTFFVFPWDYQAVVEDARFETRRSKASPAKKKGRGGGDAGPGDDVVLGV